MPCRDGAWGCGHCETAMSPTQPDNAYVASAGTSGVVHEVWRGENTVALSRFAQDGRRFTLAYLDPPYNTKRSLRYKDRFGAPGDHAKWVAFLRERLKAVALVLEDGGVVAVSIDTRELAHLMLLMDECFGERNRLAIIVQRVKAGAGLSVRSVMDVCEYLVVYTNNVDAWKGRIIRREAVMAERGEYQRRFVDIDAGTEVYRDGGHIVYEHDARTVVLRPEDFANGVIEGAFCTTNAQGVGKILPLVPGRSLHRVVEDATGKTTWFHNHRVVVWLEDRARVEGSVVIRQIRETTLWDDISYQGLGAEGGVSFQEGKKPVAMLQRLVSWFDDDISILDPFAGSGSMIHAVAAMNHSDGGMRRVVSVTNDENGICTEVCWPRVVGVITGRYANGRVVAPLSDRVVLYKCDAVDDSGSC